MRTEKHDCINLDKLSFGATLNLSEIDHKDGVVRLSQKLTIDLEPNSRYKIKTYHNVGHIYYNDQLFAILGFHPMSKKDKNYIQIDLLNSSLYTREWLTIVNQLASHIPSMSIREAHIAYDLEMTTDKQFNPYETLRKINFHNYNFHIKVNGRTLVNNIKGGIYVGDTRGNKYMRVYDKTLELLVSKKDYIKDFWSLNGIDTTKKVIRQELVLKRKKVEELEIDKLNNPSYLHAELHKHCNYFYQFYTITKGKRETKSFIYHQIDKEICLNKYPVNITISSPSTEEYNLKRGLKIDFDKLMKGYKSGDQITVIQCNNQITTTLDSNPSLLDYFKTKGEQWKKDYISKYESAYPKEVANRFYEEVTTQNIIGDYLLFVDMDNLDVYSSTSTNH